MKYLITAVDAFGNNVEIQYPTAIARNKVLNSKGGQNARALLGILGAAAVNVPEMVERTNIISGKTFLEEKDTPYYCSPSSETYWSM